METRHEVQEKERTIERNRYQVWILALALLLALAVIVQGVTHIRRVHRRNDELRRVNDAKEELIQFLAKDLKNPVGAMAREIADLSAAAPTLRPEEIRVNSPRLVRRDPFETLLHAVFGKTPAEGRQNRRRRCPDDRDLL